MSEDQSKKRAIDMALTQIERQFGKGSIMKLGGQSVLNVPVISTLREKNAVRDTH